MNPTLQLLMFVRSALERGEPPRQGLIDFAQRERSDFANQVLRWVAQRDQGQSVAGFQWSAGQRALLDLVERGSRGESIGPALAALQSELVERAQFEVEEFVALLPIKSLIPLLLFVFPSYLMVLLGPLLESFLQSLEGP